MMQPRTCPSCGGRYMADADNGQAVVGHQCRDEAELIDEVLDSLFACHGHPTYPVEEGIE